MPRANRIEDVLMRLVICEPTTMATGCWEWPGAKDSQGYGRVGWKNKVVLVYRLVYEHFCEPIPAGLVIDHLCRNPRCANFEHLEPVTDAENRRRGIDSNVEKRSRTHCPQGHEYSGYNLISTKKWGRKCRTCNNAWNKARRDRKKNGDHTSDHELHPLSAP